MPDYSDTSGFHNSPMMTNEKQCASLLNPRLLAAQPLRNRRSPARDAHHHPRTKIFPAAAATLGSRARAFSYTRFYERTCVFPHFSALARAFTVIARKISRRAQSDLISRVAVGARGYIIKSPAPRAYNEVVGALPGKMRAATCSSVRFVYDPVLALD